ncbi:MAG: ornithine cyclodeaminase family protein [Thermacetogeniaceae bacterium]
MFSGLQKIPRILYMTIDDVRTVGFTDEEFINCVTEVFIQHNLNKVEVCPTLRICPKPETSFQATTGWVEKSGTVGLRWVSTSRNNNPKPGFGSNYGVLILSDQETGVPYALMDAFYITMKRTAATTAVSAKFLARKDAETAAIIGAGAQGRESLKMLQRVLPKLKRAKIFDIRPEAINGFMRTMAEEFRGEIISCSTIKEAVEDVEVLLITATCFDKTEHQIKDEWIPEKGVFLSPIAMIGLFERKTILRMDKIVTDDLKLAKFFAGTECLPFELPMIYGEIGEIITGRITGRENDAENILALNFGLALHDIYIGRKAYEVAKEKGIGTWLDPLTW